MPKTIDAAHGMTILDLMSEDGVVIDVGEDDHTEDEYPFKPNVHLTNDEMIKLLNMEEFAEDDDNEKIDTAEAMMPWSISFDKIKAKSEILTKDGKITKLIKQTGVGETVPPDCLVIVHYGGYFEHQDEPFDSTFARGGTDRLRLGQGALIYGLEIGIRTMKKGETACFVIHQDYAYGELGCPPLIPPSSEVLFIIHVQDYIDGGLAETLENLSVEDRKQFKNVKIRAVALIKTGAESFKRGKTRQAIREYNRAVQLLENAKLDNDEEEEEMKKLISRAYGNLAVCFNKEDKPRQACRACLSVPNPTAKIHFHHGRALIKMGEYKRALEELQLSLKDDPTNKYTINEIQLANELKSKYVDSEKKLWLNCLKVRNGEKTLNEYAEVAKEFCNNFVKNDYILRQPLPEGLSPAEDKCIRQQAAILGLIVTQQTRYGKDTTYLAKKNY